MKYVAVYIETGEDGDPTLYTVSDDGEHIFAKLSDAKKFLESVIRRNPDAESGFILDIEAMTIVAVAGRASVPVKWR